MNRKKFMKLFHRGKSPDTLMRAMVIEMTFPRPELVSPVLGARKFDGVKERLVVCAMYAFHNTVFPWLPLGNQSMDESPTRQEFVHGRLAGFFPFGEFHGKLPCVISPH
jgi:hypothetical protein